MIFTFQILFRAPAWTAPQSLPVQAETAEEAEFRVRALFPTVNDLIVSAGPPQSDVPRCGLDNQEAAWFLGVKPNQIVEWRSEGLLPESKPGFKSTRLPIEVLERFHREKRFGLKSWEGAGARP